MFWFFDSGFIIFVIPAMIFAFYAQSKVKSAYAKFAKVYASRKLTGGQVARQLLDDAGLEHVEVVQTEGHLTDHYDPRNKVIRLSPDVYGNSSLAALGITAHEVGHAIQHDTDYLPLTIRNSFVPIAGLGSQAAFPLFFIGFLFQQGFLMDIGIAVFLFALFFHAITLPVELNASKKALTVLASGEYLRGEELNGARKVLQAAALTYVAAMAVALAQLLRLLILRGRD